MTTLLTLVEGANTGILLWNTVGPFVQQALQNGADANTVVTQEDLDAASIDLGHDIDDLDAAIQRKKARDAAKG